MRLNWFLSRSIRHATQMHRHVRKLLNAQRDLLSTEAVTTVERALQSLDDSMRTNASREELTKKMEALEKVAVDRLRPYPNAALRENIEVLLVAIAVAMGIRTFFLQPFKIPTGSMQPTLYGITPPLYAVTPENANDPNLEIPGAIARFFKFWFTGISYTHVVAEADGQVVDIKPPRRLLLFNLSQKFQVGPEWYTVWFPPDDFPIRAGLWSSRSGLNTHFFRKGEDIVRTRVISGDHLFVDRFSYNFRRPTRGEIIVFETRIPTLKQDQFYIKRLAALSDETVQIRDDRRLSINGVPMSSSTPGFEMVYSFTGAPEDSKYSGYLNESIAEKFGYSNLAPLFTNEMTGFTLRANHYLVLGDNTVNSADSRTWGDFPRDNVIGKSYFVYWPIGAQDGRQSRFGWGYR